jgi:hypothetical protein
MKSLLDSQFRLLLLLRTLAPAFGSGKQVIEWTSN